MQSKELPNKPAARYLLVVALPLIVWSLLCFFVLLPNIDQWLLGTDTPYASLPLGICWLASAIAYGLLGLRLILPAELKCPSCGEKLTLRDDGEATDFYYTCERCTIRWETKINRGRDD